MLLQYHCMAFGVLNQYNILYGLTWTVYGSNYLNVPLYPVYIVHACMYNRYHLNLPYYYIVMNLYVAH